MLTVLVVVQLITCALLIALVLLQDPKGGSAGGVFGGGGSNTLLGATGATTFLVKLTRGAAISFGILCLVLTWYLKRDTGSVIDTEAGAAAAATAPGVPAGQPAPADTTNPEAKPENAGGETTTVPPADKPAAAQPAAPADKK